MKKMIWVFICAVSLTGCTTEDDANVPDGLLKRVHVQPFVGEDEHTLRYYYNGYKLDRIESSDGRREIYYYDRDLIVNIKNYEDTDLVGERQYQYDNAGKLVQFLDVDYVHDDLDKRIYAYNPDGTVTGSHYSVVAGTETLDATQQFFFSGGEVAQDVVTTAGGNTQTTSYTYDDKLVPEHGILGYDKIRMFDPARYKGIHHNIVNVVQTSSGSPEVGTYAHVWQYNSDGAPTYFSYDDQGTIIIDAGWVEYYYK